MRFQSQYKPPNTEAPAEFQTNTTNYVSFIDYSIEAVKKKNFQRCCQAQSHCPMPKPKPQFMFEVSSFKDTRQQTWAPLLDSPIDDFLTKALPFLDQPLLQVTDVANESTIH